MFLYDVELQRSKRIFIFLSIIIGGGAEKSTYSLACGLQEAGYDVTVVLLNGADSGELGKLYQENLRDLMTT